METLIKLAERNQIPIVIHSNANWIKPIHARGVIFQKKEEPSKEYYDKLLEQLIKLAINKPKVLINDEERMRLSRPNWHKSDARNKLRLLLNMNGVTLEEKEVLAARLKYLEARDAIRLDRLQNLSSREIEALFDTFLKIEQKLHDPHKKRIINVTREKLQRRSYIKIQRPI